jgi:thiosulfate reductase cytochrome b subunit
MADEISAKELLDKLGEYHKEIVALAREVTSSVKILEEATSKVRASEKKWWVVHKNLITGVVSALVLLLLIVGIGVTMSYTNLCIVNVSGNTQTANITSCKNR